MEKEKDRSFDPEHRYLKKIGGGGQAVKSRGKENFKQWKRGEIQETKGTGLGVKKSKIDDGGHRERTNSGEGGMHNPQRFARGHRGGAEKKTTQRKKLHPRKLEQTSGLEWMKEPAVSNPRIPKRKEVTLKEGFGSILEGKRGGGSDLIIS